MRLFNFLRLAGTVAGFPCVRERPTRSRGGLCRSAVSVPAVLGLLVGPADAATFSVGPGTTCTHNTLQAALDSAASNSGADVVRIVRTATWTAQQISTQTDQDVEIVGGWEACTAAAPSGRTTLSGSGGQARSVIALRGNADFTLRNLEISGGDQAGDDDGGGIHFQGGGILRIVDTVITGNSADEGGGLYAHGTTPTAEVIVENSVISFNSARNHGGGAVAQGLEMTLRGADSALMLNSAGGQGGGLLVRSGAFASYAYISGGVFGVQGNSAARGGGIAVVGGVDSGKLAEVQVFSTDGNPVLIAGNQASERGGGIDLQPDGDTTSGNAPAVAQLRNVDLRNNGAPVGAAVNLAHDSYDIGGSFAIGGQLYFNRPYPNHALHPSAAACPFGRPCGYIRDNTTGNLTGAVVHFSEDSEFNGSRLGIERNTGGWLMYLSGEETTSLHLDNSLIAGNSVQNALIRDDQNQDFDIAMVDLYYVTIAGNTVGANGVLSINEDLVFSHSLVDQPGKALIATDAGATGGTHSFPYLITNTSTVPGGATLAAPRFVDAANGDYLPRAGARAVDFAPPADAGLGVSRDLYGHTRMIDLPLNPNETGASDVGALEREYLQPLVLNGDFDADLNQWETLATAAWDTSNISGAAGSGSLRGSVAVDQARVAVRRQCIHLPGPGLYALDGWGRVTGAGAMQPPNRVWLDWELRYSTATIDGCTNAPPALSGSLQLASGNAWTSPAVPALIDVAPSVWGPYTSLTVYLVVQNGSPIGPAAPGVPVPSAVLGGPLGWFDGITLTTDVDDTIFADGFE